MEQLWVSPAELIQELAYSPPKFWVNLASVVVTQALESFETYINRVVISSWVGVSLNLLKLVWIGSYVGQQENGIENNLNILNERPDPVLTTLSTYINQVHWLLHRSYLNNLKIKFT